MARPQKEGMDYFPHDNDAVNDEKIEALRVLYGNDGYAFYFILLERIYRTAEFELDVSDAETTQILCRKVAVTEEKFNAMLETALKRKCFDQEAYEQRSVLTSTGIKKRASVVIEKREFMRSKYKKVSDAETTPETREETPQRKGKERKGKERLKESKEDSIPYGEIINYLNSKTGKSFSPKTDATIKFINGRWEDGRTLEDFKRVIDTKCKEWLGKNDRDGKPLANFLRPNTLFSPTNFENYLNQVEKPTEEIGPTKLW